MPDLMNDDSDHENKMDVADMFGDFGDAQEADSAMEAESVMVDALMIAVVSPKRAKKKVNNLLNPTFIEIWGRTITDYTNASRRNLNVKGISSLDFRTPKADGTPWDFRKRSDRHAAMKLIEDNNPDWVLGAPPCNAFSIWNYGLNYKKMDPEVVFGEIGRRQDAFEVCMSDVSQADQTRKVLSP